MLPQFLRHWSLIHTSRHQKPGWLMLRRTYKVLFFGSDNFSIPSLRALHEETGTGSLSPTVQELAAVTSFKGTDNAVRKFIKTTGIRTHSWPLPDPERLCAQFDVGVVVSFGHLIPESIIEAFPLGMINVHASLLPRWRGAAPIIHALLNGDSSTGVTIMRIRPRHFDVGEVLAQREMPIGRDTLMPELHARLAEIGAELLVDCVRAPLERRLLEAAGQDERMVTYAPKVTDQLAHIDWLRMSAAQVYNCYRALHSFRRLHTTWLCAEVRIVELCPWPPFATPPSTDQPPPPPGTVQFSRTAQLLRVWCADGQSVGIRRLSVRGKKTLSAGDFHNGYLRKSIAAAGKQRPEVAEAEVSEQRAAMFV